MSRSFCSLAAGIFMTVLLTGLVVSRVRAADGWPVVRGDASQQGVASSAVAVPLRLA